MFYRRRSVYCRVLLNSKTFTHIAFLTHANHAINAKISTHATHAKILWTHATHAKILWTHVTHATHAKIWPTPPTLPTSPTNPRHPRDLADSGLTLPKDFYRFYLPWEELITNMFIRLYTLLLKELCWWHLCRNSLPKPLETLEKFAKLSLCKHVIYNGEETIKQNVLSLWATHLLIKNSCQIFLPLTNV